MRKTDRESALEEAIKAALAAAPTPPSDPMVSVNGAWFCRLEGETDDTGLLQRADDYAATLAPTWALMGAGKATPIYQVRNVVNVWSDCTYEMYADRSGPQRRIVYADTVLEKAPTYDLIEHLRTQSEWSARTFGRGARLKGLLDHLRKELVEVEADPTDVVEWIDVAILAFDGAWRAGHAPELIAGAFAGKLAKNMARTWPDWRTMPADKAIEHDRSEDASADVETGS